MKILVVDDIEENRYLLESLLRGNGYEVRSVANGQEALDVLRADVVDLVVSDILMPVMDGFQLCRKMRAEEAWARIPFVVYTATYTGPKDEEFALRIGADRFVRKPCEPDDFLRIIREVMESAPERTVETLCGETEVFKLYSERLIRKLEEKMLLAETEIESRRVAEENLREAEKRWRTTFDAMLDPVALLDVHGTVLQFNRAFMELLDNGSESPLGKTCHELIHHSDVHIPGCPLVRSLRSGTRQAMELKMADRMFYVVTDPIHDTEGKLSGFVHIMRDVSEQIRGETIRRTLEEQLNQAQKMESVGRLASGVAHDFNNLLSIILGYGDLLLGAAPAGSSQHAKLGEIVNAANRARNLTRQLLAFSRKQLLEMKTVDLNRVVAGFESLLRRLIGEDTRLDLDLSTEPVMVRADSSQLEQVLMNLAVNARDAMPDGGILKIRVWVYELDETYAEKRPNVTPGRYATISVSDSGCGMDADTMQHIFEPFFTTKGADIGTGLGLSTSYGIVKQHGGNIWVYSEPGIGTHFNIYLPIFSGEAEASAAPQVILPLAPPTSGVLTVMIVEDDPHVRELSAHILSDQGGYTVIEADGAVEAVERAKRHAGPIHLVLADVIMPQRKGPEIFEQIRESHPEARVLYMSGYADSIIVRHGALQEGVAFIQKPFTVRTLLEKCRNVLMNDDR